MIGHFQGVESRSHPEGSQGRETQMERFMLGTARPQVGHLVAGPTVRFFVVWKLV